MQFKPIRFPTYELHNTYKLLTARQMYILNIILKKHKSLPFDKQHMLKRRNDIVCRSSIFNTKFAKKQFMIQCSSIYNKVNKIIQIYPLTINEIKRKLPNLLLKFSYKETENLVN